MIEGIDEAIIGTSVDEPKAFTTKLVAGEHAGQDAEVTVTIKSVKVRELPEPDDEFAQLASEFDTIDDLRADLRERLTRVKRMQQGVQARDKVLEALLEVTEVPLPDSVVDSEVEVRQHDAVHTFDHDEDRLAEFLTAQGKTREEFDTDLRTEAEKAVKTQLVLDQIADVENLTVDDNELTERIIYQAQRFGVSPDEYVKRAQQSGQLGAIFADVRRGKALASVVRLATVTDASGNPVDLEELFGPREQAEPAEEPATADQ
jgi:trigger factor